MRTRWVGDQERDPAVLHRRTLGARRQRNYRQRQREKQGSSITGNQAQPSSQAVETATENHQVEIESNAPIEPGNSSQDDVFAGGISTSLDHEPDGPSISDIEQNPYGDNVPVSLNYAEESGARTESHSPAYYAEEEANVRSGNTRTDVEYATEKFIQQFLVGIHGCGAQKHREYLATHIEAEGTYNHHGLDQLLHRDIPV